MTRNLEKKRIMFDTTELKLLKYYLEQLEVEFNRTHCLNQVLIHKAKLMLEIIMKNNSEK